MHKLNHIEPVGFGTQENPHLDAWCLHATSIKMGDPTKAVQWGGSRAQQPVKNAGGSVCDPYPLPPQIRELEQDLEPSSLFPGAPFAHVSSLP